MPDKNGTDRRFHCQNLRAESWLLQARMQFKRLTPQNMELESTFGESYFLIY